MGGGDDDDAERKTSAPAKLKARKDSLEGLTKEERLAKRKASMTAGDSWEDLHGTKDRPKREVSKARAELAELAAAHGVAPATSRRRSTGRRRRRIRLSSSDGAGPSSYGDVDVDIEQPAAEPELRQRV